jgi:glycosyltransferase involved in cell wall biosynthesis
MILVEHEVVYEMYRREDRYRRYLRNIRDKEAEAVREADRVFVVSGRDLDLLRTHYDVPADKVCVVPNGVDVATFRMPSREAKLARKAELGLAGRKVVLFAGSGHFPNIQAVGAIHEMAGQIRDPEVLFVIAGTVGNWVQRKDSRNIVYTGSVKDIQPYFEAADIAICPILSGGGTNLKLLEYMACGLPVITTEFGVRGLCVQNGKHALVSPIEGFPERVLRLLSSPAECEELSRNARELVETSYSWTAIAKEVIDIYEKIAG